MSHSPDDECRACVHPEDDHDKQYDFCRGGFNCQCPGFKPTGGS